MSGDPDQPLIELKCQFVLCVQCSKAVQVCHVCENHKIQSLKQKGENSIQSKIEPKNVRTILLSTAAFIIILSFDHKQGKSAFGPSGRSGWSFRSTKRLGVFLLPPLLDGMLVHNI